MLLKPALEAVMKVAREGEAAEPTEPAPAQLRRYLRFARLPAPALDIARRVVEEDDAFRERVASQLTEDAVGEAGWLWLTRPDGWEARLDELRKTQQEQDHALHEERAERESQRRLAGAEDRARRAEVALTARTQEVVQAVEALAREQSLRGQTEAELARVVGTIDELTQQRNAAVRRMKEVEAELAQRSADLRHARHELRMRDAETEAEQQRAAPSPLPVTIAPVTPAPSPSVVPPADGRLAALVADAARAAELLSGALAAASELLAPAVDEPEPEPAPEPAPASAARLSVVSSTRQPLTLPPGVADDSVEAVEHLVRAPGAVLLVDGYNISQAAWYQDPIARQRARLVDALSELHARTGVEVEVVFDGADVDRIGDRPVRPAVRVRFSAPGVEADDVVLDLVDAAPPRRPVIVASSDHRVRDGARRRGANVIGARQLLGALRR
jgi:predicted RNA-binding protein with PIN domain